MLDKGKKRLLIDLLDDDVRHDIEVIASFDEDEIGSRMTTNCIIIQKKCYREGSNEQPDPSGSQKR